MTPERWTELAERFGLGRALRAPAYVGRGSMGEIWRLETGRGAWAVKWQFPWAPAQARPADVQVQLAAAAAGIPLPRPVLTPAGEAVAEVGGQYARVYEWVDLAAAELPPGDRTAGEAGRLLGLLHRLALPSAEPDDPWYTEVPSPADWAGLVDRAAAAGRPWAGRLTDARARIAGLSGQAAGARPGAPRIVCHRDFNPDNVFPAASGGHLVVLDWENAGPLDPRAELGYALFAWSAGRGQVRVSAVQALLDGYAAASGARPAFEPGMFTTAVAAHLNFLRVMAERAIGDPGQRDYAEQQISGLLGHDLDDLARFLEIAPELLRAR